MITLEHSMTLPATRAQVFDALIDPKFFKKLESTIERVSRVELISVEEIGEGVRRRVARYTAPAELPRFLKRYKDRAPAEVFWEETLDLNFADGTARFQIRPEAPGHWHERYENQGILRFTEEGGTCKMTRKLEFSIDVSGLSFVIERALKPEVDKIFQAQDRALLQMFR